MYYLIWFLPKHDQFKFTQNIPGAMFYFVNEYLVVMNSIQPF